jgi:hypothetical protein
MKHYFKYYGIKGLARITWWMIKDSVKGLFLILVLLVMSGCTKTDWNEDNIQVGYQFHYDVSDDNRPYTGPELINPWTIDSKVDGAIKGVAPEWWCHSANGVSKMFDATIINKGNPHKVN